MKGNKCFIYLLILFVSILIDTKNSYSFNKGTICDSEIIYHFNANDSLKLYLKQDVNTKKFGYKDSSGNWIINPKYDYAFEFGENHLARVEIGEQWGLIKKDGTYQIPLIYNFIGADFKGKYYIAQNSKNKYGIIDTIQKVILSFNYSDITYFTSDLAKLKIDTLYGLFRLSDLSMFANVKFKNIFEGSYWSNDLFMETEEKTYWYKMDKKVFFDSSYTSVKDISRKFYLVTKKEKYGIVSINNENIIPVENEGIKPVMFGTNYVTIKNNRKWGLVNINKKVDTLLQFIYDDIDYYKTYFLIRLNGKWGLIDEKTKRTVIPFEYSILKIGNKICYVEKEKFYGFLDYTGNVIDSLDLPLSTFDKNLIPYSHVTIIKKQGKYGLMLKNYYSTTYPVIVLSTEYDSLYAVNYDYKSYYLAQKKNGDKILLDDEGKVYKKVLPCDELYCRDLINYKNYFNACSFYRNCGNEVILDVNKLQKKYHNKKLTFFNYKSDKEAKITSVQRYNSIIVEPDSVANTIDLKIFYKKTFIDSQVFQVAEVPSPSLYTVYKKNALKDSAKVNQNLIKEALVGIMPDQSFASYFPKESRYKFNGISYKVIRNGNVVKQDSILQQKVDYLIPLESLSVKSGDVVVFESKGIFRLNYNDDKIPLKKELKLLIEVE